ncbi:MAG: tRNA (adenosine(37)-N6)-threonylcarbamoyltransferase complex ATPase subunit type 1 TsaE [Oscillospiraceae bacterium]|jgi:tRNA threonylcarbamoyladenosine biosynthesis protein TsaE|nr:tRNA (adenosine(37)-N6)-threonylcarbamoyltransferase complex ATPase subunit type 1 TsaE [Oscillospiraceae bacterium]
MEYISHSEYETEQLGTKLAERLKPGDVIALCGTLGAGKTAFTRGIAAGLGYSGYVNSPTFTIVNEYLTGQVPIFHFDLYRLDDSNSVIDIGWDDYLRRAGVCVAEWSDRAPDLFPKGTIYVNIGFGKLWNDRIVRVDA